MLDLAQAKRHLRVDSESEDVLIQTYLDAAISTVEGLSGQIVAEREVRQSVDQLKGRNGDEIELSWRPVVAVEKIEYVDPDGSASELLLLDNGFRFVDGRVPYVAPAFNSYWPSTFTGRNSATIVYSAGYGGLAGDLPADLEAAVLLLLGHLYMNREAVVDGTAREVPIGVRTITDRYRDTV